MMTLKKGNQKQQVVVVAVADGVVALAIAVADGVAVAAVVVAVAVVVDRRNRRQIKC